MGCFNLSLSRRCIAVDLGQSRIKAMLVERKGRRVNILHAFTLDLQEEGLLTLEETNRHINRILLEMGDEPLSLVVPQHIAVSHMIALPASGHGGWERMIEEETQKLTGLSDSTIIYDYFRLKPFQRARNPVWVTVGRERELEGQIKRVHGADLNVEEVTNTGNALASTYLATQSDEERVVLVDVGAASTTVVMVDSRQPVYATSFPFGGELFTEAIATARGIGFDEAETAKKTEALFKGHGRMPVFVAAVERWHRELEKTILEWVKDQPGLEFEPLKVILSGGVSLQPGFLEYLRENSVLGYELWPTGDFGVDRQTYSVAYGAALAGLKLAPVSSSLLPKPLRQERFRAKQVTALNSLAAFLLVLLFTLLVWDTSVKQESLVAKTEWITDLSEAHAQTAVVKELLAERNSQYNEIVPIVQRQKRTRDLLKTIGLMQEVGAEHDAWFVLLADGRSYNDEGTLPSQPYGTIRESRSRGVLEPVSPIREQAAATDDWNRFVVEISVPGTGREIHDVLRSVVNGFDSKGIFRNVDTLAAGERKQLVDPAVTLPDQTFSLTLELVSSDYSLIIEEARER